MPADRHDLIDIRADAKVEPILASDARLPKIVSPFIFFRAQRRMTDILHKKPKLFICACLQFWGKREIFLERFL